MDRSYIGGVERGERNPALDAIFRLATALKVAPAALFDAIGENVPQAHSPEAMENYSYVYPLRCACPHRGSGPIKPYTRTCCAGRDFPRRSPARRGAAGITGRSSAAATTDGITSAADSEGSPAQGSPPGAIDVVSDSLALIYIISSLLGSWTNHSYLEAIHKIDPCPRYAHMWGAVRYTQDVPRTGGERTMRRRRLSAGEVSEMRRFFDAGHTIGEMSRKYKVH